MTGLGSKEADEIGRFTEHPGDRSLQQREQSELLKELHSLRLHVLSIEAAKATVDRARHDAVTRVGLQRSDLEKLQGRLDALEIELRKERGRAPALRNKGGVDAAATTISNLIGQRPWRLIPGRLRRRAQRAVLFRLGVFDAAWYLAQNDDVAQAGADPVQHFLSYGHGEGRLPHPWFAQGG